MHVKRILGNSDEKKRGRTNATRALALLCTALALLCTAALDSFHFFPESIIDRILECILYYATMIRYLCINPVSFIVLK